MTDQISVKSVRGLVVAYRVNAVPPEEKAKPRLLGKKPVDLLARNRLPIHFQRDFFLTDMHPKSDLPFNTFFGSHDGEFALVAPGERRAPLLEIQRIPERISALSENDAIRL